MYEAYYGLKEKPFSIQPDPDFLFMSKRHRLAFAMLEYGLQNRVGFSVLCGEVGCGKTTLVRKLLGALDDSVTVGLICNTHEEITDLLEWVMLALGQPYRGMTQVERYDRFQQFLLAEYAAGRRVVLIVDEAQNLHAGALESLRMLSNINADKDLLLQVVLVGQPELKRLLNRSDLRQFTQRVGVDFFIPPLSARRSRSTCGTACRSRGERRNCSRRRRWTGSRRRRAACRAASTSFATPRSCTASPPTSPASTPPWWRRCCRIAVTTASCGPRLSSTRSAPWAR
jgi:type II secretory pathway predicted ATPase ExeA